MAINRDDNFTEEAAKALAKEAAEIAKGAAKEGKEIVEGTIKGLFKVFNPFG